MTRGAMALALAFAASGAAADTDLDTAAEAAIRGRLEGWAAAFNARDAAGVCDLFAEDLVSVVPEAPDAGKAAVCDRLARLLARDDRRFGYAVEIEEVLVWGERAAVRLNWTLSVEAGGATETSLERGIDLFRREPDGAWRIMRFIAFTDGPAP